MGKERTSGIQADTGDTYVIFREIALTDVSFFQVFDYMDVELSLRSKTVVLSR